MPTEDRLLALTGARIRERMDLAGIGTGELANAAGISRATLQRALVGERDVRLLTLASIAAALDIDMRTLVPSPSELRGA